MSIALPEAKAIAAVSEARLTAPMLPAQLGAFAFHPDGHSIISISGRGGLLSCDLSQLDSPSPFDPFAANGPGENWGQAVLERAAGARSDGSSGGVGQTWLPEAADTTTSPVFLGNSFQAPGAERIHVASPAYGPDRRTVALANPDGTIKLWDTGAPQGAATAILGRTGPPVSALVFSPATVGGYRWLACGDRQGTVRLWDLAVRPATHPSAELPHKGEILSLAFSPDGRWLVTGPDGGPTLVWDLKGGPPAQPALSSASQVSPQTLWHSTRDSRIASPPAATTARSCSGICPMAKPGMVRDIWTVMPTRSPGSALAPTAAGSSRPAWPGRPESASTPSARAAGPFRSAGTPERSSAWRSAPTLAAAGWQRAATPPTCRLWRLDSDAPEPHPIPIRGQGAIVDVAFGSDGRSLAISGEDKTVQIVGVDEAGHASESSLLFSGQQEVTTSLVLDSQGSLLIAAGPRGSARVWPLRWVAGLDQLVSRLDARNLTADEWDQQFPKQDYRKTFEHQPVHRSLIDAALSLAKDGQKEEAIRRLRHLLTIDPELDLDPEAEVNLATAEGALEIGRTLARQRRKDKAIEQFRAALRLMPQIGIDPQTEADRYEALQAITDVEEEISNIRSKQTALDNSPPHGGDAADAEKKKVETRVKGARKKYETARDLAHPPALGLVNELARIERRLNALELDRNARGLLAEGKIEEAVEGFKEAKEKDSSAFLYSPEIEARQVGFALARQADANGRTLAAKGEIKEATKQFEVATKLAPGFYQYFPRDLAQQVATESAKQAYAEGRQLAAHGEIPKAAERLRWAQNLDPGTYGYGDPEQEAKRVIADGNLEAADALLAKSQASAADGHYLDAKAAFKEAKKLDHALAFEPEDYLNRARTGSWSRKDRTSHGHERKRMRSRSSTRPRP